MLTSTSTGNVSGVNETISPGTPPMSVFDYQATGQRLYMGTAGWAAGTEDASRYIEFNTAPTAGNAFAVNSVSFEYGAANRANAMASNVWFSTDGWNTRTQLLTTLTYPQTGLSIFTANPNVTVPGGGTFSLRIYPFATMAQTAGSPQFSVHNTVRIAGTTEVVLSGTGGFCSTFEGGGTGLQGWSAYNTTTNIQTESNGNHYIWTEDDPGTSYIYTTDPNIIGDWRPLFEDGCGSLCFDVKFISGQGAIFSMTPSISIEGGGFTASFVASTPSPVGGPWRRLCAPLKGLNPDGSLPSNADGQWVMAFGGSPANWTTLISNVTRVRLATDPSPNPNEQIGYDNICTSTDGNCTPPPPPEPGTICGLKYNDLNGNGRQDAGELGLGGWPITLTTTGAAGPVTLTTTTDENGSFCFVGLAAATYTLAEGSQSGWTQTQPQAAPGTYTINLQVGQDVTGMAFGNQYSTKDCTLPVSELTINTGLDHTTFSPYAIGGNDAFWTITLDADTSRTVPRPAEVVTHVTAIWNAAQPNSQWIAPSQIQLSSSSSSGFEQNDVGLGLYRYALELCIVGASADRLDFNLSLLSDNVGRVYLRRPGDTDNTRLFIGMTTGTGFAVPTSIVTTLNGPFAAGTYVLEVDVQNDGISPDFTGMNMTGSVSGANLFLQKHECCNSSGKATGTKFNDVDGDGVHDSNEPGMQGITIELLQGTTVVATTTTDGAGDYFFDVAPGTYTIREVVPMGYTQTAPTGGTYTVTIGPGGIVSNRDFGNQVIPCIGAGAVWKCRPTGGSRYLELTITNNGTMPVSYISATSLTPGVTLTQFNTVTYPVAVGASAVLNFNVTGLAAGAAAQVFISMHGPPDMSGKSEECCSDTLTVVRPGGPGVILQACLPHWFDGVLHGVGSGGTLVPLGGWVVRLRDQAGRSTTTTTGNDGYFLMEGIQPGTYMASVDVQFGWRLVEPASGFYSFAFRDPGTGATGMRFVVSDQTVSGTEDEGVPSEYVLHESYPNPFYTSTVLRYDLPQSGPVRLEVFDMLGRRVATLVEGVQAAGRYAVTFDAGQLGGGMYLYRMTSGAFSQTKRMVLMQ